MPRQHGLQKEAIENALSFLEEPSDRVILQVPYERDVRLAADYVLAAIRGAIPRSHHVIQTPFGVVRIESVASGLSGLGSTGPYFLIPRTNGDEGLMVHDILE